MILLLAYTTYTVETGFWQTSIGLSRWVAFAADKGLLLLGVLAFSYMMQRGKSRFVRQYLHDRGVPICTNCGYDIHGLPEPRCPECGQPFDPYQFSGKQRSDA